MPVKLLILDLDRTLWDHPDISQASPPFRRVERRVAEDSRGTVVRLRDCAEELLRHAKQSGMKLAIASWNFKEPALSALEALGVLSYFDVVVIEPHPRKEEMIRKILREVEVAPEEALFIDDNELIVERVLRHLPALKTLRFGVEIGSFCELLEMLQTGKL